MRKTNKKHIELKFFGEKTNINIHSPSSNTMKPISKMMRRYLASEADLIGASV